MATDSEEVTTNLSRDGSVERLPLDDCSTSDVVFRCQICNERYQTPRVLQCLHVFCTPCLDKLVESGAEGGGTTIACPTCKQTTKLAGGVADLLIDVVAINMMEMADIRTQQVRCTSCKADEKAVARCSDCSSFLCPSCVTAHNYMRCFENHKVESFEELCKDENRGLHKPMFCNRHTTEGLKYFCITCEVPVCTECMVSLHKLPDHRLELIGEVERKHVEELEEIVETTRGKLGACENVSGNLEGLLSDLQLQRDNASDLVNESFQSYKAALEKCKDELLKELEAFHSSSELAIMELFHNVEETVERIEDGCKFSERVLKNGNMTEILLMKKLIQQQLVVLLNNIPRTELNVKIEFVTDADRFGTVVKEAFGHFKSANEQEKTMDLLHASSMHSSFEGENFNLLSNAVQPLAASDSMFTPLVTDFMPGLTSLPAMSTSPISDLASSIMTSLSSMSIGSALGGPPPALHSFPYPVERSLSRNSYSPLISDSGIIADAGGSSSSSGGQSLSSLQTLLKMGNLGLNSQGQITINGQAIPGLNLSSSGLNQPLASNPSLPPRVPLPMPSVPDQTLAGLFNTVGLAPANSLSPATQLNEISALFNSLPPHQSSLSLGAVRAASPISAAVVAANLLGPPPNLPPLNGGMSGAPGGLRVRSSGKISSMDIRCKFGQLGPGKGQFNSPHGFCLGIDEDIVVADTNNHRIQVFEKNGEFKYQFGTPGREEGQLWYPRKVAVIRATGKYVICDRGSERSRMQLFTKNGQFIKKIAIRYIDIVAGLAITGQGHIVAVDSVSPTVFCISENGDLVKWFDCSDYMREPSDIAVSGKDYYVCDFKGHCVVVFNEDGQFLHRIGCENITNYPNGIDISDAGDVLIGDSHGNRFHVAVFQRDGHLIGEFECPYVKVSRCCGLKITSEGYVVTLAKNNQHVLVLNTLYIA